MYYVQKIYHLNHYLYRLKILLHLHLYSDILRLSPQYTVSHLQI